MIIKSYVDVITIYPFFVGVMHSVDDNADAEMILLASPPMDWRR